MEFLTRDLDQLFTDRGIDASAYDEVVDFRGESMGERSIFPMRHL